MKVSMNPDLRSVMLSPALPSAIFLFGLTFCLAIAHFTGLAWQQHDTVVLYASLFVWVLVIAWRRRDAINRLGAIDVLFSMFVITIMAGVVMPHGEIYDSIIKSMYYLPFMVLAPYLCGRMMISQDVGFLSQIMVGLGLAVLPLLLIEFLISPGPLAGRWMFFGLNHGSLLVGCILAIALTSLCEYLIAHQNDEKQGDLSRLVCYGLIGIFTITLVWVRARGWLVGGLVGVAVVTFLAENWKFSSRLGLFFYVVIIAGISLAVMPRADARFYAQILIAPKLLFPNSMSPVSVSSPSRSPVSVSSPSTSPVSVIQSKPILGKASCSYLEAGVNSIMIRSVLYQEAAAIFMEKPLFGMGSARFGEKSCVGVGGFPHSTILQSFAELGLLGGGLLLGVFSVALIALGRRNFSKFRGEKGCKVRFVLALLTVFLIVDQVYGNYFVMVGTCLMLGITARMQVMSKKDFAVHK